MVLQLLNKRYLWKIAYNGRAFAITGIGASAFYTVPETEQKPFPPTKLIKKRKAERFMWLNI